MIKENLVAERIAIDSYGEMIRHLGNDDPTSARCLRASSRWRSRFRPEASARVARSEGIVSGLPPLRISPLETCDKRAAEEGRVSARPNPGLQPCTQYVRLIGSFVWSAVSGVSASSVT